MEFEAEFDAALNLFLSFGYFETDDEHIAMLAGIARALRPGGRFLMEFWNREYEIRYFDQYQVERTGEVLEVEEWEFDHLRGRLNWTNTAFFPDGRRESWWHSISWRWWRSSSAPACAWSRCSAGWTGSRTASRPRPRSSGR
jgi:SAM-dependent methyltransferase